MSECSVRTTGHGLRVEGVCVARGGTRLLTDVSITVEPGRVTALFGRNGAGKSTLVLAMAGVLPLAGGTVTADGTDVTGWPPPRRRAAGIATVPEGHRLLTSLTVRDNLLVACRADRAAAVTGSLDVFPELDALLDRPAGTLSGGQQQMVAIAQALVSRPRYLLIDELSLGLAPVVITRLADALGDITASGVGVLLIEQFAPVALALASTAVVLGHGSVRWTGAAADLRDDPSILRDSYLSQARVHGQT